MSTTGGTDTFQLTIRCAMQSFPDHDLDCPANWSVLQLKQHLAQACVTKPDPSRQRLIYAGHCLNNEQMVRNVLLAQRRDSAVRNEVADKQVIHMVYIGGMPASAAHPTIAKSGGTATSARTSNTTTTTATVAPPASGPAHGTTSEGLRHRANIINSAGGQPNLASVAATASAGVPTRPEQQQLYAFVPAPQQQQPQSYEAWMSAYQNYMHQMAHLYQQQSMLYQSPANAAAASIAALQQQPQQAYAYFGAPMLPTVQHQQQLVHMAPHFALAAQHGQQQQQRVDAGDAPVAEHHRQQLEQRVVVGAGGGVGEAVRGAAVQADLLDIVYKSVRFALLAMVLYVYSSLERFFLVLAVLAFFWFVHRRRNQAQQQDTDAAAADAPPEGNNNNANAQANNNNYGNDAAAPNGRRPTDGAPTVEAVQQQTLAASVDNNSGNSSAVPQQPSAWSVFFTVVQSFFTSLVPNPMPAPMDIN